MIGYVLTAAFFYLLSKTKKHPSMGRLPGNKITRGQLLKKIRKGEAGNICNNDLFFEKGYMWDNNGNIYKTKEDQKEAIISTQILNDKHLRSEDVSDKILSYDDYFGFYNHQPQNELEAYYFTLREIANGLKFIWEDDGVRKGLKNELFGKDTPGEKKYFRDIISPDGTTIEKLNEDYTLEYDWRDRITEAIQEAPSRQAAKQLLSDLYNDYCIKNIKQITAAAAKNHEATNKNNNTAVQNQNKNYRDPLEPLEEDPPFQILSFLVYLL